MIGAVRKDNNSFTNWESELRRPAQPDADCHIVADNSGSASVDTSYFVLTYKLFAQLE